MTSAGTLCANSVADPIGRLHHESGNIVFNKRCQHCGHEEFIRSMEYRPHPALLDASPDQLQAFAERTS